jgi:hypothetical protein
VAAVALAIIVRVSLLQLVIFTQAAILKVEVRSRVLKSM